MHGNPSAANDISIPLDDYRRYGRQMIIDGFGLPGQLKLQAASVIVVGVGGLGCPALQYLCAAGIGRIGIVDPDIVEISNLQRQILHSEATLGEPKVDSAANFLRKLNSSTLVDTYDIALTSHNAASTLAGYDIILDCTDNAPTRYLLSDMAVHLGVPLVSGSAQRLEGQLCVYNLALFDCNTTGTPSNREAQANRKRGPCYRCLFPRPPAPELVGSCSETGILGGITGVIGSLQAVEAIKLLTGLHDRKPSMLIYSALSSPPFRHIALRSCRKACVACGDQNIESPVLESDYVAFCGGARPNWIETGLNVKQGYEKRRIYANEALKTMISQEHDAVRIIDVRSPVEFGICHLSGSVNIPLARLLANPSVCIDELSTGAFATIVVVCRLGNDSQIAMEILQEHSDATLDSISSESHITVDEAPHSGYRIVDLIGGLRRWSEEVDPSFPIY